MVQRHTIPLLKAQIVDKSIPGGKGRGSIKDLSFPLFLKSSIYHKESAWQAKKNATPPIFRILIVLYQTFQMRYCLFLYYSWFSLKLMKSEISILGVR